MKNILTDLNFLQPGVDNSWPPNDADTRERLKTYNTNKLLYDGKHDRVYTNWIKLLREDNQATMEIILNWHRRLTKLFADLLLGEVPRVIVGDIGTPEQINIDRIIEDNNFFNHAYKSVIDCSRYGDGLLKLRYDKRSVIEVISPTIWFPVVDMFNCNNILNHVLAWKYTSNKTDYLRTEIHYKGKIQTNTYLLEKDKISQLVESNTVSTGIEDFLIIHIPNLMTSEDVTGNDDYKDIDSIIQEIEVRFSQISRILDKHTSPHMYGPDIAIETDSNGQSSFRGGGSYFPITSKDEIIPGYIVWESQLPAAFKEIEILLQQLFYISESSPAAFGDNREGLVESGSALKRLFLPSLIKVNRIRLVLDPAIKKILKLASKLELVQGKIGATAINSIFIEWRDGLVEDDAEKTNLEVQKYGGGISSLESSVRNVSNLEGERLQKEINKINAEKKADSVEPPKITLSNTGSVV